MPKRIEPTRGASAVPGGRRPGRPPVPRSDLALPPTVWGPAPVEVIVRPSELPEHVFRRLLGAYLGGAPEFVVRESPTVRAATRSVVRTFCRRTRQPEIVSDDDGTILVRDLAFESPVPLERRLEQMGQQVVRFHREAVASWSRLPLGDDGRWERRDDEIDREAWYLERKAALQIGTAGPAGPTLALWTVARSLERIADHAVALGEVGQRLAGIPHGTGPLASLEPFHAQAMRHLEGVLAARDEAEANDLLDTGEALIASGRALADRLLPSVNGGATAPAVAAAIARLLESTGRTIAYGQDIAQVVLDRALAIEPPSPADPRRRTALPAA